MNVMKNSKFHCGRVSKVFLFLVSKTNYIIDNYIVINVIKRHGVDVFFKNKFKIFIYVEYILKIRFIQHSK